MTGLQCALLLLLLMAAAQNPGGGSEEESAAPWRFIYRQVEPTAQRARTLAGLATTLKERVDDTRKRSDQLELVFLIDASASVGETNFRGELNFVRKLLSDFTMEPSATRVSIVTFAGRGQIVRHVDYVSQLAGYSEKCQLLNKQLDNIIYTGGGTYTHGALMEAFTILENSRAGAEKVVFLVTDGFSNGGDPRFAANLLKGLGVTIFTFGIQTGNVDELRDIASEPSYAYSYFLNSFLEFETLARKALHRDLRAGVYAAVSDRRDCDLLCAVDKNNKRNESGCCDAMASCTCGTASGHYACICPVGYYGTGLAGFCQPCPNGTYGLQKNAKDLSVTCVSCPDANHITRKIPAVTLKDCICAPGFTGDRGTCEAITCPKLKVPENGYFVKANECNNVVNAACGIRCRIGFHLTGDSIRLCSENGSWTGEETQCLLKTCVALRAPANGRIRCEREIENSRIKISDKAEQPIDTRCQFKCESGFQLLGSKVRNCLPLARWDGLKTTCRPIFCEPLKPVVNAEIHPKICMGPKKLPYTSNCTITCKKGYKLEGPRTRTCIGRHGTWSKRHSVSRCVDKTCPVLNCPANMTVTTLPGKNYAYVNWLVPNATDNSGAKCNVWSRPHVTLPWKVHIGKHTIKYIAQDISGNKARCSFNVNVLDKEPPKIENCLNNQLFLNGSEKNIKEFTWDEPNFYDNSGLSVKINKTFHPAIEYSTKGRHFVSYRAVDKHENVAKCLVSLTIQDACDNVPRPLNGRAQCINIEKGGKQCHLFCDEGYAFSFSTSESKISQNRTTQIVTCNPTNHLWNVAVFPDCSAVKVPNTIIQEGNIILEGDSIDCNNTKSLNNIVKHINNSYNFNVINICNNKLECKVKSEVDCNKEFETRITRSNIIESDNTERVKRSTQRNGKSKSEKLKDLPKKEQIEIKFTFIAKIIEENQNNTRLGITKLREKIQSLQTKTGQLNLLDSETNKEIGKLALNLHILFKDLQEMCDTGSILKKNDCVKCLPGTFHSVTRGQCQSCPFGEYQSESGATKCEKCPNNFFTRRTHARSSSECIAACQPGYYSRRRHHPELSVSLVPCTSCEIGFYQPQYGQSQCLPCPRNTITEGRASAAMSDCLPVNRSQIDFCRANPCLNRGACIKKKDGFSCECRDHYVGSRCEIFANPCISSPCSSAGQCILRNNGDSQWSYICMCKPGYTGTFCEALINECSYSPCRNGGTCLSTDTDFTCTCKDGFEGDFCEVAVNHCLPSPCEVNSTCRTINGTWKCFCRLGYLGLRCNLLPCDWLPCHPNEICINIRKHTPDKSDYRCECPPGYTGKACLTRINHCKDYPCQNNATCINNLLNYTCNCHAPFAGSNCEIELSSDYIMHFSRSGTTDYVIIPGSTKNLSELTVCFWLQSIDTFNYGTVVSYATPTQDNAFTVTDYNGFVLYVNGEKVITDARMNDGYWHFICVSWENKLGSWQFYVDGTLKDNGTLLAKNTEIQGGGMFVFGQEQDDLGGGFSESESFLGKLSLLDIWDTAIEPDIINNLSKTCEKYLGSLIAWAQLQEYTRGKIEFVVSPFCQGCRTPVTPFKGYININKDGLEVTYSCETGYEFRKNYETFKILKKTCLKHGNWNGSQVPNCVRITCPFPGYFLRGRIQGRSYLYGDKISYICNDGYNLRGNTQRICKADGKWSGITPFCMGITCKNLLAPDHGDIEYIIAEHDRDDLSILQVGQQLEFICNPGYFLTGQRILTCLENGTWDFKMPSCISMGCPPPIQISHGRIVANISSDITELAILGAPLEISRMKSTTVPSTNEVTYYYGDIVSFSCEPGYKFEGNYNLLAEFKLQCTTNGTWKGHVPDCISLQCPRPNPIENARIYILKTDRSEGNSTIAETILEEISTNLSRSYEDSETANKSEENITADMLDKYFIPGAQIKIVCNDGYAAIAGSIIQTCTENEIWSGDKIYCEFLRCPVENHPIIGLFLNNNTAKSAIETQEFMLDVEVEIQGKGNDTDLSKKLTKNFDFFYEGDSYGEKVILQCRNNFRESLQNEVFNENNLELIWKCDKEGKWQFINEINEKEITEVLLNEEKNICTHRSCKMPNVPLHGYIRHENSTEIANDSKGKNRSVTFKCNQGYALKGPEKSFCLTNATWSTIPTCERISCEKPQLLVGASIQGNSYLYQDRLVYICPGGKFRNLIVCNRDGRWSALPKCTENI